MHVTLNFSIVGHARSYGDLVSVLRELLFWIQLTNSCLVSVS